MMTNKGVDDSECGMSHTSTGEVKNDFKSKAPQKYANSQGTDNCTEN